MMLPFGMRPSNDLEWIVCSVLRRVLLSMAVLPSRDHPLHVQVFRRTCLVRSVSCACARSRGA